MQIVEEKLEEEMVNINKTVFIRSEISSEPHFTPTTSTLLALLKWPLIGTGAAIILIIIFISAIKLIKNHSNSGVSVTIQNSATSSNNSPTCTEATAFQAEPIILPSCPAAAEVQTGPSELHLQDAPPDYYSTVDIDAILAVKPKDRNAFERRAVAQHSLKLKDNPRPQNQV